jgi:hypothetical protein
LALASIRRYNAAGFQEVIMKFRVCGADRETGEDVEVVVEAQDAPSAQAKANKMGLLVTAVDAPSGSARSDASTTMTAPSRRTSIPQEPKVTVGPTTKGVAQRIETGIAFVLIGVAALVAAVLGTVMYNLGGTEWTWFLGGCALIGILVAIVIATEWMLKTRRDRGLVEDYMTARTSQRTIVGGIVAAIVIAAITAAFSYGVHGGTAEWVGWAHHLATWGTVGIGVMLIVRLMAFIAQTRCPSCAHFGMAVLLNCENLGTTESYRTRTRKVEVRAGHHQGGDIIANYDIPDQVREVQSHWREHRKCRNCGHHWSRDKRRAQHG